MSHAAFDLDALAGTRHAATHALAAAFATPGSTTEAGLARAWVQGMHRAGLEWCWYSPPPEGTAVLSGAGDVARLGVESFRPEECWPGATPITVDAPVTVYTSPVSAAGVIGDVGLTVYRGTDQAIRDHLHRVADLVHGLTETAQPGMAYRELYQAARTGWAQLGLTNDIASSTDPAGTNIGHSIPFFGVDRPALTRDAGGARTISDARVFVSGANQDVITDECAFTVEPRLGGDGVPVVWFHVVVAFVGGRKHVVTEFEPVLGLEGCEWFEHPWAAGSSPR